MNSSDQSALDQVATGTARRQCQNLFLRFWPEAIPPVMVGTAAATFETAARRAVADLAIAGDRDVILERLGKLWRTAWEDTLRRLAREDRAPQ
ncbi:MAG: hypothetical protein WA210_18130 [Burkholderiaceae bacterium]